MKTTKVTIVLIVLLSSCAFQKKGPKEEGFFHKTGTLRFKVDSKVNPYAIFIKYFRNQSGKEFLYMLCNNNQFLKYDYATQKQISKIILQKEGPNGVGIANGMNIINENSILITSRFHQKLFFVDSLGSVTKSFSLKNDSLFSSYTTSNFQYPVDFDGQKLILPQNLMGNWNNVSDDYFTSYTTLLKLDLQSKKLEKFGVKFPFKNSSHLNPEYCYTKWNNLYIFSFVVHDDLIVLDKNNNTKSIFAKTTKLGLISSSKTGDQSIESILRDKIVHGAYGNLIGDSTNNLLYRFYRIGNDKITANSNLMEMHSYPQKFGIQVFDKDFKIISDNIFPEKKYFFNNSFLTKDGLLISCNHPDNPDFDLNYFTFDIFSIKAE